MNKQRPEFESEPQVKVEQYEGRELPVRDIRRQFGEITRRELSLLVNQVAVAFES
jgi:hypothetical protein